MRRSEEKLALHVRQTPLAVIEWDMQMTITAWNPAAEQIFGYSVAEAVGKNGLALLVPSAVRPTIDEVWQSLLRQRGGTHSANENITKDGRVIVCEWYNTPLVDAAGQVIGVASHAQDVTEREELEKQLRQAQKMESVGQLAGGVAHEFNNLLTPMLMQTELLLHDYAHDEKLVGLLRPMQAAIEQAAQLNQRILAVGRRGSEQREPVELNLLVENAVAMLRPLIDRRIGFAVALAPALERLSLDRSHIPQIVMNLVLNARDTLMEKLSRADAAGWTPRLAIATAGVEAAGRHDGGSALPFKVKCQRLSVTDNGLGIGAAERARIFEPFFTTKEPGKGTGLGLAIVWNITHALGGWVEVEDGPGGEGTAFHVYFPVRSGPASALDEAVPEPVRTPRSREPLAKARRILLVEDNALVSETFRRVLTSHGHSVTSAADGQEGWEMFNGEGAEFDLVLADYNMPRLNGADLLKRVKKSGFAGRFVVASGYLTHERIAELRAAGADEVLRKPFTPAELLAAIDPAG